MTAEANIPPGPDRRPKLGYLMPEFPGQTHVWLWREIQHMQEAGARLRLFSTQRPPERDRARHHFAEDAAGQTTYLWPLPVGRLMGALAWATFRHPIGLLRAGWRAVTLPVDRGPAVRTVLPLLLPACALARAAEHDELSHLHVHSCANSAVIALLVKRISGLPYSVTLHADLDWWGGAMAQKFDDAAFVVVITRRLIEQMREEFPRLTGDRVLLGPMGVDTVKWCPQEKPGTDRSDESDGGPLRVLALGRLHYSKGYDDLLNALHRLTAGGVDWRLTLIGEGPERDALTQQIDELALGERVTLTGSLGEDQIIGHMREADVFVLSSHAEPLGVVTMEAMSMGLASVATDAGGVREIMTHERDGLLVPPKDPAALAEALRRLAEDEALRQRLAAAGRRTVVERFDSRHSAGKLFERLTGERPTQMLAALDSLPEVVEKPVPIKSRRQPEGVA